MFVLEFDFHKFNNYNDFFQQLLAKENEIKAHSITASSKQAYHSCLNVYEHIFTEIIKINPYPINEDKIIAFLIYQKDKIKRNYSTPK